MEKKKRSSPFLAPALITSQAVYRKVSEVSGLQLWPCCSEKGVKRLFGGSRKRPTFRLVIAVTQGCILFSSQDLAQMSHLPQRGCTSTLNPGQFAPRDIPHKMTCGAAPGWMRGARRNGVGEGGQRQDNYPAWDGKADCQAQSQLWLNLFYYLHPSYVCCLWPEEGLLVWWVSFIMWKYHLFNFSCGQCCTKFCQTDGLGRFGAPIDAGKALRSLSTPSLLGQSCR